MVFAAGDWVIMKARRRQACGVSCRQLYHNHQLAISLHQMLLNERIVYRYGDFLFFLVFHRKERG